MLLSEVAKITGAKDTHEKERERHEGRERDSKIGEQRGGQSEIIIIVEVVFQGQYLRFSSTNSLKHNPPPPTLPSVPPLSPPLPPGKLLSSLPFFSHCNAFPLSLIRQRKAVSHPSGHCLRRAKSYSRQLPYSFSNTGRIKWAINKQTGLLSV